MQKKPEITAPVSNFEMCLAAVHNGADAVYLGLPGFNARARAAQIGLEELKKILQYCRLYGVKTAVCANILAFESELEPLVQKLLEVLKLEPDHLVVQDLGIARLLRFLAPGQAISASTQMSITDSGGIEAAETLELNRYILAREIPLKELGKIKARVKTELEVFVHGALCISYSGQCLASESHGGRSANRGECAQCCRLPYQLSVDGEKVDLAGREYLLSPEDLCALDLIPALSACGIEALKIEGRLKTPEYVAAVVRACRRALDAELSEPELAKLKTQISLIFSRGMGPGFLLGERHQQLVSGFSSGNQGLYAGEVLKAEARRVRVASAVPPEPGYGVLFTDSRRKKLAAGNVYAVKSAAGQEYWLEMARDFKFAALRPGSLFFINAAPDVEHELKQSYTSKELLKRIPVTATLSGKAGEPLVLKLEDPEGRAVVLTSAGLLENAKNAALEQEQVAEEIGALSGSCFSLAGLNWLITGKVFLHRRAIRELRQSAMRMLEQERLKPTGQALRSSAQALTWLKTERTAAQGRAVPKAAGGPPALHVLIRRPEQIEALAGLKLERVYLDFAKPKLYRESVSQVFEAGFRPAIATPRVQREGEAGNLKMIREAAPEAILVRNLSALNYFKEADMHMVMDASLNVTNSLSAAWLLALGAAQITPGHDLDAQQMEDLIDGISGANLEVCLSHHMPLFHTQHCLYAALLGKGNCYPECQRPCREHRIELLNPYGERFLVELDAGRRNTIYKLKSDEAPLSIKRLVELGVQNFRVEALDESVEELRATLQAVSAKLEQCLV